MSIQLPAAPENFYTPSLLELKNKLLATNGSSKGRAALIYEAPVDGGPNMWNEVGVAWDSNKNGVGSNRGTFVIGHADIGSIDGPILGPIEKGGEPGYKLQFGEIKDIPVIIDGTGTTFKTAIGVALLEGVDSFSQGKYNNVRYIIKIADLIVTDGTKVNLPAFEIIINFSEVYTGV